MIERHPFPPLGLSASALVCGRGGVALTERLTFAVAPGQCLLLRGPNGTGKTTLVLTLAGIVGALEGSFAVMGGDDDVGPHLHYCGHSNAIKPRLTTLENLQFWRDINGATGVSAADGLNEVGLGALSGLDAGYLSAGQSRRLALARLLVSQRPIWLLDEPTAALDSAGHALVTRLLDAHLALGGLAIVATHDPITLSHPGGLTTITLGGGK